MSLQTFDATIEIIGVNPFVYLTEPVLQSIFDQASKNKGPIPVCGTIDGHAYLQTIVKFSGHWRLYINGPMLKAANKKIGDSISVEISFDDRDRSIAMHPELELALNNHPEALAVFNSLSPHLKKEIVRYIANLKTPATLGKNISRAIQFLLGNERFVGRPPLEKHKQ